MGLNQTSSKNLSSSVTVGQQGFANFIQIIMGLYTNYRIVSSWWIHVTVLVIIYSISLELCPVKSGFWWYKLQNKPRALMRISPTSSPGNVEQSPGSSLLLKTCHVTLVSLVPVFVEHWEQSHTTRTCSNHAHSYHHLPPLARLLGYILGYILGYYTQQNRKIKECKSYHKEIWKWVVWSLHARQDMELFCWAVLCTTKR